MELETDIVPHANGSARLRLANTDILVGVKAEVDTPSTDHPDKGKIEFFVDWCVFVSIVWLEQKFILNILPKFSVLQMLPQHLKVKEGKTWPMN